MDNLSKWVQYQNFLLKDKDTDIYDYEEETFNDNIVEELEELEEID